MSDILAVATVRVTAVANMAAASSARVTMAAALSARGIVTGGVPQGAELIGDGEFYTGAGWVFGGEWEHLSLFGNPGAAQYEGTPSAPPTDDLRTLVTARYGATYRIKFTLSGSDTAGVLQVLFAGQLVAELSENGSYEYSATCEQSAEAVPLIFRPKVPSLIDAVFLVEGVSVRRVIANTERSSHTVVGLNADLAGGGQWLAMSQQAFGVIHLGNGMTWGPYSSSALLWGDIVAGELELDAAVSEENDANERLHAAVIHDERQTLEVTFVTGNLLTLPSTGDQLTARGVIWNIINVRVAWRESEFAELRLRVIRWPSLGAGNTLINWAATAS